MDNMEIDLNAAKSGKLNEGFLRSFGYQIEYMLKKMFGLHGGDVKITGTDPQIRAFAAAMAGEKSYIDSYNKHGLGNKSTFQSKWQLDQSIRKFESETGLKWPLK